MGVEYRILGPLEVVGDGGRLALGGVRMRALLAFLLLHANELVTSRRLIDELWGAKAPAGALNTLQVYISRLRRLLGPDALETQSPGYVLRIAPESLDLNRFCRLLTESEVVQPASAAVEQLRAALALWRGEPLADLAGEEFAQAEIRRLEELRLCAIERWVDAELALGNPALVAELESLVQRFPLRERFRAQLMVALYREGRQADSLAVYREARRLLSEELGLEPGEQLRALEQRILVQDPALLGGSRVAETPAPDTVLVVDDGAAAIGVGAVVAGPTTGRELVVAQIVAPGDVARLAEVGDRLAGAVEPLKGAGAVVRTAAFSSSDPAGDVERLAGQQEATLLLIGCAAVAEGLMGGWPRDVLARVSCDVGLVAGPAPVAERGEVLVPFGAAFHDWAALELGAWLARSGAMKLRLLGALGDVNGGERDASRLLADASLIVQRTTGVVAEPLLRPPGVEGVLEAAATAALLVVPLSDRWEVEGLGPARAAIAERTPTTAVFVRRGIRPGGLAPSDSRTRFTWSLARS